MFVIVAHGHRHANGKVEKVFHIVIQGLAELDVDRSGGKPFVRAVLYGVGVAATGGKLGRHRFGSACANSILGGADIEGGQGLPGAIG